MIEIVFNIETDAWLPKKGSRHAAGYDIYALNDDIIPAKTRKLISTGVHLYSLPYDNYIRIAPRSGLAVRNCIDIAAGVVDADYRGEIKVVMVNNGNQDFHITRHDRIAQLIVEKFSNDTCLRGIRNNEEIIEQFDFEGEREDGGFGSTGLNDSILNIV